MPPDPKWYDSTGATELTAEQLITAIAGIASSPLTVQIINNKDGAGASALLNARLKALFRDDGATAWVGANDEWPDRHYMEIRQETGGWNTNFAQSEWVKVGANATFPVRTLANDEGVKLSVRVNTPVDPDADVKEFTLRLEQSYGEATSVGITESAKAGIYLGMWDRGVEQSNWIALIGGDAVENPGGTDQNVQIQDVVWLSRGFVYSALQQLVNHPLAATDKVRYDLVHLDSSGSVTRLVGTEVDGPLVESDKPTLPSSSSAVYYVEVDETGPITDTEIENVWSPLGYFGIETDAASLVITLGSGRAVVDNSLITNTAQLQLTLPTSDTSFVWMLRNGNLFSTLDERPAKRRPMLLYEVTTDGSGVTGVVDRRSFQGERIQRIHFEWLDEITVDEWRYAHLHSWLGGQVLPLHGVVGSLGEQVVGSGLSGQTQWDVEVETSGSFASLFSTGGDHQPEIAFDATDLRSLLAMPEDFNIPADARMRAKISEIPAGTVTTNPKDASLTLLVAS